MVEERAREARLEETLARAALWMGAFSFSFSLFLALKKLFRHIPPTPATAVGRVTVDGASKLQDYLTAALFFALVPLLTVLLVRAATGYLRSLRTRAGAEPSAVLFAAIIPIVIAPLFFLTTGKEGWGTLLPLLLAWAICEAWAYGRSHRWPRVLLGPPLRVWHSVAVIEAVSWILYRYIATGKRIAHIPTLFLEVVFVVFFIALFWFTLVFISLLLALSRKKQSPETFPGVVIAFLPLLALPVVALTPAPSNVAITITLALIATLLMFSQLQSRIDARTLRRFLLLLVAPLLLFVFSYSSVASLTEWIDLFHRGETLGPASDYLRGDAPYRDVFVLHGMLEDGLLDALLMQLFGRDAAIAATRAEVLSSLMAPALWYLGIAATRNGLAALAFVFLGFFTAADNQRGLFEIVVVALLLIAIQRVSRAWVIVSAALAALTLFFSLEIGLYCIGGSVLTLALLRSGRKLLPWWVTGFAVGALPFVIYLLSRGGLEEFFATSFVIVPRTIDATWSLPFPDLVSHFRNDLTVRTFVDFFLGERFRFVLNPLVIGIALTLLAATALRKRAVDPVLLTIAIFALLTQRSALGRADFPHQYFSAFLVAPLAVLLIANLFEHARLLWRSRAESRPVLTILAAVATPLFAIAFWIPDLLNARLDNTISYRQRLLTAGWSDGAGREVAERIGSIQYSIQRILRPNDPMFDFSNQPALYFFADRPNPTRFFQIPIISPRELQLEAIRDLETSKPRLVLRRSPEDYDVFDGISNDARAAAVSLYIDDHYRYVRSVRGVELWLRRAAAGAFNEKRYISAIPDPRNVKDTTTKRVVFPAVGSLRGASANEWRSELVVHNPSKEPLMLRMRYLVPNQEARERSVVVSPEETLKFVDVARDAFAAPETRGMLLIEHPRSVSPILRLRTFDAARDSESTLESPLDASSAARSGEERLVIVGARGGWPRRVNLGVVNAGNEPARVRVTMRTPTGAIVGVPLDLSVEEGGSALVVHGEAELGAPITPDTPIHIQILDGSVWAFASSIDGETGHQQVVHASRVAER